MENRHCCRGNRLKNMKMTNLSTTFKKEIKFPKGIRGIITIVLVFSHQACLEYWFLL